MVVLRWRETKTNLRRSAWLGMAGALGVAVACGGNSSRHGGGASGTAARNGAGGTGAGASATAGAGGSSGAAGARGGGAGAGSRGAGTGGGPGAGTSGGPTSGVAGVAPTTGGASGSGAGTTGGGGTPLGGGAGTAATSVADSSAGADAGGAGPCIDLCQPDAPACCTQALRCMSGVPMCRLDVLADHVDPQYQYPELVEKVAALSDDIAVSIGDAEIEKAAVDPEPAARIELHLTPQASATHGPALKNLLNHPFRVSCDGAELYVGVVYIREGAAALQTPVLHVEDGENDTIRLLLGAQEGEWTGLGGSSSAELKERLDRSELRASLCERGILSELGPPP